MGEVAQGVCRQLEVLDAQLDRSGGLALLVYSVDGAIEDGVVGGSTRQGQPFLLGSGRAQSSGVETYRPHLPWVMKIRWNRLLAAELFKYVEDARVTAFCLELCWAAVQRFSRVCANLGI